MSTASNTTFSEESQLSQAPVEETNLTDGLEILAEQHKTILGLFDELSQPSLARRQREKTFERLQDRIRFHSDVEEKLFYPFLMQAQRGKTLEAIEEHSIMRLLLKKMEGSDLHSEEFDSKIRVLQKWVAQHFAQEEVEQFALCRKHMSAEEVQQLAQDILQKENRKRQSAPTRRQKASLKRRAAAKAQRSTTTKKRRVKLH